MQNLNCQLVHIKNEKEDTLRENHLELGEGATVRVLALVARNRGFMVCWRRRRRISSELGWRRRRGGLEEEVQAAWLLFRRRCLLGIWEGGIIVGEGSSGSP
jgi:hypothetical protein